MEGRSAPIRYGEEFVLMRIGLADPSKNEYAKEIREYRNQDKGKAYGKVFVKGIRHQACVQQLLT